MSFKVDGHRKSDYIKVTHYVSPHEIWFKYDDAIEMAQMLEIQQKIQQFGDVSQRYFNHSPLVGEIVIVRYCSGGVNKFIRGRIDFEYKYRRGSEFILWAMDEGYPVRCRKKWIMQLPSGCLQTENPFVFKATLNNILPATLKCNTLDFQTEIVKTNCWSEKAINQVANLISDSKALIFHYDCHAAQQYLFGSIEVISHAGKSFTLADKLKDLQEAVDSTANFENEYQRLIHKNYWDLQQNNYKIKEIGYDIIPQLDIHVPAIKVKEMNVAENVAHNLRYRIAAEKYKYVTERSSSTSATSSSGDIFIQTSYDCVLSSKEQKTRMNFNFKPAFDQKGFQQKKRNVLMHCSEGLLVQSISSLEQTKFSTEVCDELRSLQVNLPRNRTQAVVWPHLMRGHSLILVNPSKTPKTLTYLPAVCSLLSEAHTERVILESEGPVMIIICINSTEAERVLQECRKFLKGKNLNENFLCKVAYGQNEKDDIQTHLLNGIDVLVTTIPCLLELLKNPFLFNKKRVITIVFDEIDSMCNRLDNVTLIYKEFCTGSRTQFVVTSKTWHSVLETFCQKDGVLLCISSYIEAAIYSGVEITVNVTDEDDHDYKVFSCIKRKNYSHERTVIICYHPEEVIAVKNILLTEGISTIFCHEKSNLLKISAISSRFNQNRTDDLDVLVCTDEVLLDLKVRRAQHLIHYSIPPHSNTFKLRFVACFEYCENLVQDRLNVGRPTTVIFGDADAISNLPKKIQNLAEIY